MTKMSRDEWLTTMREALSYGQPREYPVGDRLNRIARAGGYERYVAGEFHNDNIWEFWTEEDDKWGYPLLGEEIS